MASDSTRTLANGAKLVGETLLPGSSLLMDGRIGEGASHALVGIGARLALGPIGVLGSILVAANSFSKSVADRNLWDRDADERATGPTVQRATPGKGGTAV